MPQNLQTDYIFRDLVGLIATGGSHIANSNRSPPTIWLVPMTDPSARKVTSQIVRFGKARPRNQSGQICPISIPPRTTRPDGGRWLAANILKTDCATQQTVRREGTIRARSCVQSPHSFRPPWSDRSLASYDARQRDICSSKRRYFPTETSSPRPPRRPQSRP